VSAIIVIIVVIISLYKDITTFIFHLLSNIKINIVCASLGDVGIYLWFASLVCDRPIARGG
jgi:hypothetical protein